MRQGRATSKTLRERQKGDTRIIPRCDMAHHHSEVNREATSSSLLHPMPDQVSLKRRSTGRISNGVADITHLPNRKLIIRPKIRVQQRVRSLLPQRSPFRFLVDEEIKITRDAARTALAARHLEGTDATINVMFAVSNLQASQAK